MPAALQVVATREGAAFEVKVQPGASATRIRGEHGGALKVAVAAPPERGKANEELVRFLARALGCDRRALEIVAGETGRKKRVLVRGAEAGALGTALERILKGG
jgi:uncharacterized protein (TIGR00251 family)